MKELEKNYNQNKSYYKELLEEVVTKFNSLLKEDNIKLGFEIESRVKELESIIEKCKRDNLEINEVSKLNDIAGIRLVALFQDDIKKVERIIESNFKIEKKEDTLGRLDDNKFGYGSIHYEVFSPDEWFSSSSQKNLKGLKIEIQLRTASQHIWAATSHILQYKREKDIPIPLKRTINRTAALLEIVDLEFNRIRFEKNKFKETLRNVNIKGPLDVDTLKYIFDETFNIEKKENFWSYSSLLQELEDLGVKTVEEFKKILSNVEYLNPHDSNPFPIVKKVIIENVDGAKEYYDAKHRRKMLLLFGGSRRRRKIK